MIDTRQPAAQEKRSLRLLLLEDSPNDAEIEVALLERAGYACRWERVHTQADFLACLLSVDYDLILADYNLPQFNGLKALELVRSLSLDTPFVFVSGVLGEERAIESLKAGATDYVLKNRLARLESVVQRALQEREVQRQRRQAEAELRRAKEAAETANRAKSEFLAKVSHELRTPLHGVMGMMELVLGTTVTDQQRRRLTMAQYSAEGLLRVINDILDFSKIEAGKLAIDAIDFSLREQIAAVLEPLMPIAEQKGISLACDVRPNVPDTFVGDPGRLGQILTNLIGNAIKFTERGTVVVGVTIADLTEDVPFQQSAISSLQPTLTVHFAVRDTGIGIPRDKQRVIFAPFEQVDGSLARPYGGTGLGLAISAQLVGLMGGRMWVESTVGQGSTFHFTIRGGLGGEDTLAGSWRAPAAAATLTPAAHLRPLHVLVAEDNPVNQEVVLGVLQDRGHSVVVVETGIAALVAFERDTFDVILMDVQMPKLDGYGAAAEIRRREQQQAKAVHVPIIAMTANALPRDRQRCFEAGMDAYLAKPVQAHLLVETVEGQAARLAA